MAGYILGVTQQVVILFILMMVGVALSLAKWLDENGAKQMTTLLLSVVTVCVIVKAFTTVEFSLERVKEMIIAAGALVLTSFLGAVFSFFAFRKKEIQSQVVYRFGTIFSNCGFIAIPLTSAILGDQGVFIVSIYMAAFQIVTWTYGISLCSKANDQPNIKRKNIFLNSGVIGVGIGLIIFVIRMKLPNVILSPLNGLSELNTPLAMIVTGYYLSKMEIKFKKSDLNILFGSFLRLVMVPLTALAIMYFAGIRGLPLIACMIPICAPSASNTVMFAVKYGGDEIIASRFVSFCTVLSLLTMPVLISFAKTIS